MPRYEYDRAICGTFPNFSLARRVSDARPDLRRRVAAICSVLSGNIGAFRQDRAAQGKEILLPKGAGAGCRCRGGAIFKIPRSEWKKKLL